ncbi:Probable apyrase 2 (OsAPY2) (ATP-diphosphatase) (ATP-diphosphohydrolase) (Adenosine diphosphatase) (ADPase) [Durusdinium trenchii]|uniref:Probable apyrase 2 (OsAPY2) (ATP-diphosphatase) (ATP-diphosphohydrolase) (Adenosine diphosphatase) (ADPase) n=1 Tax=Durusdinium trenchii TaxID=1381693 RepID=A0ABP0HGL2_9DINO
MSLDLTTIDPNSPVLQDVPWRPDAVVAGVKKHSWVLRSPPFAGQTGGTAASEVNVFRFDSWTLKLLDLNGAAQAREPGEEAERGGEEAEAGRLEKVFVEEEPGVGELLNQSALQRQLERLLAAAQEAVPVGQHRLTPLALRATRSMEELSTQQVDDLLSQMKGHIAQAGFKDAGVQPMSGSEEALAEWMTVNLLMGCFQPGLRGVRHPVAVVDLGGATVQMAYYLHDRQASEARRNQLDHYISRITLPFGSGPVQVYRHSYAGYGLFAAKVRSLRELTQAGFALQRHPCLPAHPVQLRSRRRVWAVQGAINKFSCAALMDYILHKETPCMQEWGVSNRRGLPKMGNCSFAGAWGGPGLGQQRVALASYFYDRMRDVGLISSYSQELKVGDFAAQADRACSLGESLNASAREFPRLSQERLLWLCFDLTFQARLLHAFGFREEQELVVVKKIRYQHLDVEASWALGVAINQLTQLHH